MIPRLGDGNELQRDKKIMRTGLENDSPSRGRKHYATGAGRWPCCV